MIELLARRGFDAAIIFTVCTQSALPAAMLCRLAGIPLRLAHCRENPYELLTHWVPDPDVCAAGMRHEVARQLDLARAVGFEAIDERMLFRFAASDAEGMRAQGAAGRARPAATYVVVHPGASAASRRYPARPLRPRGRDDRRGQRLPDRVHRRQRRSRRWRARRRTAWREPRSRSPGSSSLGEFAALLAGARLVVCNNSGPAHIAAALGTPVVVLYALTNPQHTPWQVAGAGAEPRRAVPQLPQEHLPRAAPRLPAAASSPRRWRAPRSTCSAAPPLHRLHRQRERLAADAVRIA